MRLRSGKRHTRQNSEGGVEFKDMSNVSRGAMGGTGQCTPDISCVMNYISIKQNTFEAWQSARRR